MKWWLMAIPHYLILALLAGGWFGSWRAGLTVTDGAHYGQPWLLGSLLGLAVTFSAIALLFTGRYPRGLFDFVMGINRWAFRVAGLRGPDGATGTRPSASTRDHSSHMSPRLTRVETIPVLTPLRKGLAHDGSGGVRDREGLDAREHYSRGAGPVR